MSSIPGTARSTSSTEHRDVSASSVSPPRISVLMPVFNTASYLPQALESIRLQTCADFELVVIDDGSSDDSSDILRRYAGIEPRMRLFVRSNRGLIATRNELLAAARGELIAWMDSDDLSRPERLQLQAASFAADPALVCLGGAAQRIDPEGHALEVERYPTSHDEILAGQLTGGAMRFPTTMMRRDVALKVGGFREPFRIGEDLDLFLRLSEVGKMANLSAIIYSYRQHASGTFVGLSSQWLNYRHVILALAKERQELGTDRLQRGETVSIDQSSQFDSASLLADAYADWASHALRSGRFDHAWRYARAALRTKPLSPRLWKLSITSGLRAWQSRRS